MASSFSPWAASSCPRWWPGFLPNGGQLFPRRGLGVVLGQGFHPLAGGGLGEPEAVTVGDDDVGVVQ